MQHTQWAWDQVWLVFRGIEGEMVDRKWVADSFFCYSVLYLTAPEASLPSFIFFLYSSRGSLGVFGLVGLGRAKEEFVEGVIMSSNDTKEHAAVACHVTLCTP